MAPSDRRLVLLSYAPSRPAGTALLSTLVAAAAVFGIGSMMIGIAEAHSLRECMTSPAVRASLSVLFPAGAAVGAAIWLNRRRLKRVLATIGTRPAAEILAAALQAPLWLGDRAGAVRQAAAELRRRGLARGEAFAALHPSEAASVRPIGAGFEPVPLDETDTRFEELRAAHDSVTPRKCETLGRRRARRWIVRMLPIAAMLPGMTILAAAGAWRFVAVLTGLLIVVAAMILVVSQFESASGRGGGGWQLVPAGVLVLRPASGRWQPVLLTARNAILTAWPDTPTRRHWKVAVVSPQRWFTRRVTPMELRMLLAAWLSPLEPPEPQRFEDFGAC